MELLLSKREVIAILKVSVKTLDRMRQIDFPAPIQMSKRRIGWRSADIMAWIAAK